MMSLYPTGYNAYGGSQPAANPSPTVSVGSPVVINQQFFVMPPVNFSFNTMPSYSAPPSSTPSYSAPTYSMPTAMPSYGGMSYGMMSGQSNPYSSMMSPMSSMYGSGSALTPYQASTSANPYASTMSSVYSPLMSSSPYSMSGAGQASPYGAINPANYNFTGGYGATQPVSSTPASNPGEMQAFMGELMTLINTLMSAVNSNTSPAPAAPAPAPAPENKPANKGGY